METLRDHSPSQERHHRRHRDDHARHERNDGNGGSNRHSPSPSLDPQRERRSECSREYSSPSSSSSSRRRHPPNSNSDEPESLERSSPASLQNQQPMQNHEREPEQEQPQIADQDKQPEEEQQQQPSSGVEDGSSLELANSTSVAQPTDLPSEARATSESTPNPLLSSTLQLEKHKSKRDSQEQHQQTEAKEDAKIQELKATILELERQEQEIIKSIRGEGSPNEIIDRRIKLLHEYNEIKDVGQIILGKCAEIEGTTIKNQYEKYGLDTDD